MKGFMKHIKHLSWKKIGLWSLVAVPVAIIIAQLIYPYDQTRPYARVGGVDVGGLSRDEAVKTVNAAHQVATLAVYFGEAKEPYRSPTFKSLGAEVNSEEAIEASRYPWWLRLVPTSYWWAHTLSDNAEVSVQMNDKAVRTYVTAELGESCHVDPINAGIKVHSDALVVTPAVNGGTCVFDDVVTQMMKAKPETAGQATVRIATEGEAPAISDEVARKLIETVKQRLSGDVHLTFEGQSFSFSASEVRSWLVFEANAEQTELIVRIDGDKADSVLDEKIAATVARSPGVVTITTRDFQEISRTGGGEGRALNVRQTADNLANYMMQKSDEATVAVSVLPPDQKFIRSYSSSDAGLSALMKNFANDNPGTYGVSLVELSGQRRRASYNDTRKFTTASTYKLYVAYATLRRVENGTFAWSDQVAGGRDLAKCFDDMIVLSDNPCAEALVKKIGYTPMHREVQALGLMNTSFIDAESYKTTAGDLSTFMASLEAGQLPISAESRSRFISALKRNVYRRGIPAGASGAVANKVGFLDALLHDAAIVYAPSGTYVLTILTDGSSWDKIAELTREIEKLRAG